MMLAGTKLVNWITGFLIFLALAIALMAFCCFIVLGASISVELFAISTVVSVILSSIITYFLTKYFVRLGVGALGSWGLLSIGFLLVPLFHIANTPTGDTFKLILYIMFGSIGFAVGIYWSEAVKVYSTSLIGSYFFVRGIAMYAGGFPNEFALAGGDATSIKPAFYGYCVFIVALFVASVCFQKRFCIAQKKTTDEEDENDLKKEDVEEDSDFKRIANDMK